MDRKQWGAVEIVVGHVKELVLLVLAMLDSGDEVSGVCVCVCVGWWVGWGWGRDAMLWV